MDVSVNVENTDSEEENRTTKQKNSTLCTRAMQEAILSSSFWPPSSLPVCCGICPTWKHIVLLGIWGPCRLGIGVFRAAPSVGVHESVWRQIKGVSLSELESGQSDRRAPSPQLTIEPSGGAERPVCPLHRGDNCWTWTWERFGFSLWPFPHGVWWLRGWTNYIVTLQMHRLVFTGGLTRLSRLFCGRCSDKNKATSRKEKRKNIEQ